MLQRHFFLPIFRIAAVALPCAVILFACGQKSNDNTGGTYAKGITKQWHLSMVKYEDLHQTDQAEKGFLAGLRDEGFQEGRDFTMHVSSAGGDDRTVLTLVDKVNTDGTDMLISLQTATLEMAIVRTKNIPIVFMVVANPFVIGSAGINDSIKLSNVTGVYTMTTFERMIGYIKQCMPNVKKLGTLYSSGELNATYYKYQLIEAAEKQGIKVETFGVSSKADVNKATQALISKGIDAVCQIEDNMTSATFPVIAQVAKDHNLPVFSFVKSQIDEGACIVFAPDYYEAGKDAAHKAARIMRGESPEKIPYQRINRFYLLVNPAEARKVGLKIAPQVIDVADRVVGSETAAK